MKKLYIIALVIIIICAGSLIAYGTYLNQAGEQQIATRMAERAVPVSAALAKKRNIFPVFNLNTVNLTSNDVADAVALIDGRIENAFVQKNSSVRQGDILFQIVNEDIPIKLKAADAAIARAQAQLLQANNSFNRYQRLKDKNATSLEKYDEAKLNYEAAQAALSEARANKAQYLMQSDRQNIISPIDGQILILYKQIGSFVTAGTPVALVGDFSTLYFSTTVDNSYYTQLGDIFNLKFHNSNFSKAYDTDFAPGNLGDEQIFPAVITDISPPLNQPANLRKIIFQVDNSAGILEQQSYNSVQLVRNKPLLALTVPLAAVANNQVLLIQSDKIFRRNVTTGANDGSFIEITDGLSEGDIVVTSPHDNLADGLTVSVSLGN